MNKPLYIVWTDELNIGVNIIDEQHRGLVSIINSFYYYVQMGVSMNTVHSTLRMLEEYARIHFHTEEAIMKSLNYPGLEEHRLIHEKLMLQTQQMMSTVKSDQDIFEVMPFLKRWWMDHILIIF